PFGSVMPGRKFASGSSYRYGFNGKENDNEVKGVEGGQQDYGMRIYDPRLGRFLSVDPLTKIYPWYTPYQFAGNKPLRFIDQDGEEEKNPPLFQTPSFGRRFWNVISGQNHQTRASYYASELAQCASEVEKVDVDGNTTVIMARFTYLDVIEQNNETVVKITNSYRFSLFRETTPKPRIEKDEDGEWQLSTPTENDREKDLKNLSLDEFIQSFKPSGEILYYDLPGTSGARAGLSVMAAARRGGLIAGALHHIATNKNFKAGLQWSLKFLPLFKKAGYKLEDAINTVFVKGHFGPHPEAYHKVVFERLSNATKGLTGIKYKEAFERTLTAIGKEAATKGSELNKLLVK
ncbi:MAG: AHH domain-containing protein, partial [Chitinophagaceae bacterium]